MTLPYLRDIQWKKGMNKPKQPTNKIDVEREINYFSDKLKYPVLA